MNAACLHSSSSLQSSLSFLFPFFLLPGLNSHSIGIKTPKHIFTCVLLGSSVLILKISPTTQLWKVFYCLSMLQKINYLRFIFLSLKNTFHSKLSFYIVFQRLHLEIIPRTRTYPDIFFFWAFSLSVALFPDVLNSHSWDNIYYFQHRGVLTLKKYKNRRQMKISGYHIDSSFLLSSLMY